MILIIDEDWILICTTLDPLTFSAYRIRCKPVLACSFQSCLEQYFISFLCSFWNIIVPYYSSLDYIVPACFGALHWIALEIVFLLWSLYYIYFVRFRKERSHWNANFMHEYTLYIYISKVFNQI